MVLSEIHRATIRNIEQARNSKEPLAESDACLGNQSNLLAKPAERQTPNVMTIQFDGSRRWIIVAHDKTNHTRLACTQAKPYWADDRQKI